MNTESLLDYLTILGKTIPSFYCCVANTYGYPEPIPTSVMARNYFARYEAILLGFLMLRDQTWESILAHGDFDYIKAVELDPYVKILCLERGDLRNKELGFCYGSCPFFGGRSTFWSSWSPRPSLDLMRDFPEAMKKTAEHECCIDRILKDSISNIPTADYVELAPLAVGRRNLTSRLRFDKFSVLGYPKANHGAPLEIKVDCAVKSMEKGDEDDCVRMIETSKGTLLWTGNKTKIILYARTVPNATMLLKSFESCRNTIGEIFTGYYDIYISARCPVKNVKGWKKRSKLTWYCLVCSALGEVSEKNNKNYDEITYSWIKTRLVVDTMLILGIIYELSTCFMGPKEIVSSVDELYRPQGIENIYVTGAVLFPTAGSWNPTMTMCGYASGLAHKLYEMKP
ncbi:hypothetical protein BDP67DRAFT_549800 [Colletotrichum lupini]|nr:hypothetical protein BDP67DRAFT_549800 [Colletotrichum lupini]